MGLDVEKNAVAPIKGTAIQLLESASARWDIRGPHVSNLAPAVNMVLIAQWTANAMAKLVVTPCKDVVIVPQDDMAQDANSLVQLASMGGTVARVATARTVPLATLVMANVSVLLASLGISANNPAPITHTVLIADWNATVVNSLAIHKLVSAIAPWGCMERNANKLADREDLGKIVSNVANAITEQSAIE